MHIKVSAITNKPTVYEENIPVEKWDINSDEINFVGFFAVKAIVYKAGMEILCDVSVTTKKIVKCVRCLEKVELEDFQTFLLSYDIHEHPVEIDLENEIREEIVLNWPMIPVCNSACKGLDPKTGEKLV